MPVNSIIEDKIRLYLFDYFFTLLNQFSFCFQDREIKRCDQIFVHPRLATLKFIPELSFFRKYTNNDCGRK